MISLVMGCFRMTDMRLRVESNGSTCCRVFNSPISDVNLCYGILIEAQKSQMRRFVISHLKPIFKT